jgi:hypothetical protein
MSIACLIILCLSPAFAYFYFTIATGHTAQLFWVPLVLLAVIAGRPNLNLIEAFPWWLLAGVSWILARWFPWAVLGGGPICLLTWYVSGMARGVAMSVLEQRLLTNRKLFERLAASGCLWFGIGSEK